MQHTNIQPNDWVKTKRKPAVAAWIKRGEIFKVNAVHPIDGSIRFWNPHINQWDFLDPDEIKACPAPDNVESVVKNLSTAESVVENVIGAATETKAESVVENITSATNEANAESVVEDVSIVESVVEDVLTASGWLDFHYKVRINGKQHSTRQKQDKSTGPYYIYRWLENKKQRAKYVPGKKMGEVYRAIGMNRPVTEILKIISSPNRLDAILKK